MRKVAAVKAKPKGVTRQIGKQTVVTRVPNSNQEVDSSDFNEDSNNNALLHDLFNI